MNHSSKPSRGATTLVSNFSSSFIDSIAADTAPPLSPTFYEFLGFAQFSTRNGELGNLTWNTRSETPIGVFLELEGAGRWIDRTAKTLGFSRRDYITAGYAALHAQWCREYGIASRDMKFEKTLPKS